MWWLRSSSSTYTSLDFIGCLRFLNVLKNVSSQQLLAANQKLEHTNQCKTKSLAVFTTKYSFNLTSTHKITQKFFLSFIFFPFMPVLSITVIFKNCVLTSLFLQLEVVCNLNLRLDILIITVSALSQSFESWIYLWIRKFWQEEGI